MNRVSVLFSVLALFSGTAFGVGDEGKSGAGYASDFVESGETVPGTEALRHRFAAAGENTGEHDGCMDCGESGEGVRQRGIHPGNLFAEAPQAMRSRVEAMMGPHGGLFGRHKSGIKAKLLIMYRLVDQLNMNEDTATRFFPVYLAYASKRDSLMKEHGELIRFIAEKADDESVSIRELKGNVEKLKKNEKMLEEERAAFLKKAEKILDERQYIKLVVFDDKLKNDLISQFRMERLMKLRSGARMNEPKNERRRMYVPERPQKGKGGETIQRIPEGKSGKDEKQ